MTDIMLGLLIGAFFALALGYNVTTLYTEDGDIRNIAKAEGMTMKAVADLSLPLPSLKGKTLFDE